MNLFFLLQISVVLGNTLKSQLVHEIDELWVRNVLLLESLDTLRVSSREETDLLLFRHDVNDLGDNDLEIVTQKLVDLIENEHLAIIEFSDVPGGEIKDTARSRNNDVHRLVQSVDVLFDWVTAS